MAKCLVVKTPADAGPALERHMADAVRHITAAERTAWNREPFVYGTYTGTYDAGSAPQKQTFSLGFQPSAVLVFISKFNGQAGMALAGHPYMAYAFGDFNAIEISASGFTTQAGMGGGNTRVGFNWENTTYYYIAFR